MADLKDFIKIYDSALPADFCGALVEQFETRRELHIANGKTARSGLANSAWTEMDVGKVAPHETKQIFLRSIQEYKQRYEIDSGLARPLPEPGSFAPLILKRYQNDGVENFEPHFDSLKEVCNRYLVVLWYLNDVQTGGETEFVDLGVKVSPKAGRLLMFPPYWMYQHTGLPPVSNPKYILSTYLLW